MVSLHMRNKVLVLTVFCLTAFLACTEAKEASLEGSDEESSLLSDYVSKPLDQADQLNKINENRNRQIQQQLGE